jgi:hypothetical protein
MAITIRKDPSVYGRGGQNEILTTIPVYSLAHSDRFFDSSKSQAATPPASGAIHHLPRSLRRGILLSHLLNHIRALHLAGLEKLRRQREEWPHFTGPR